MTDMEREAMVRYVVAPIEAIWSHVISLGASTLTQFEWEALQEDRRRIDAMMAKMRAYFGEQTSHD